MAIKVQILPKDKPKVEISANGSTQGFLNAVEIEKQWLDFDAMLARQIRNISGLQI